MNQKNLLLSQVPCFWTPKKIIGEAMQNAQPFKNIIISSFESQSNVMKTHTHTHIEIDSVERPFSM